MATMSIPPVVCPTHGPLAPVDITNLASHLPTKKHSVTFDDEKVYVSTSPAVLGDAHVRRRKMSMPASSRSKQGNVPRRWLSLSLLPTTPRIRLGRWSTGPAMLSSASQPSSHRSQTATVVPPPINSRTTRPTARAQTSEVTDESTQAKTSSDTLVDPAEPHQRPTLHIDSQYPHRPSPPRRSQTLPTPTAGPTFQPRQPNSARTPTSSDVWLCSRPLRTAASLPGSPLVESPESELSPPVPTHSEHNAIATPPGAKRCRPFTTRTTSTGRLASEFDEEGRVICLSNHSERILHSRVAAAPVKSPAGTPQAAQKVEVEPQGERVPLSPTASEQSPHSPRVLLSAGPSRRASHSAIIEEERRWSYTQLPNIPAGEERSVKKVSIVHRSKQSISPGFDKVREWFGVQ